MKRYEDFIPDHSREAVSEALEAALYRAAFQRLEEKEMKILMTDIRKRGEYPEAAAQTRRRLNRRRRLSLLKAALPRLAQAAAAVIAVVSIGTGIALATSPVARQWAAGVLQSRVTDPNGFFGEVHSNLTDGAAVDGRLVVVEDNTNLCVYGGTDAEPTVYRWRDAGDRFIAALAADTDGAYVLYGDGVGDFGASFDRDYVPKSYGLGRVELGDGAFDVTTLGEVPATAILDPQGRKLNSYGIPGMALEGGKLYFTAEYAVESEQEGFSFAPANVRLFCWDPADDVPVELDMSGISLDWSPELFGGDGSAYLASYDDGAKEARVWRVEGALLTPVCQVPYSGVARPGSFALRPGDDALVYVLDGSVYVAPGMDATRAVRAALCGDVNGRGLMPDETTFAVVSGGSVEVFDLSAPLGEVNELVVDGEGWNTLASQRFMDAHPDVAIVSNADMSYDEYERYADMMLAGRSGGDVVTLSEEDFPRVRDAGLIAPLTDPELIAEWKLLPQGLQTFLSVDGQPAAIPLGLYTYGDVMFLPENWEAARGSFDDYPDTWLDYARWLSEFSRSEAAGAYVISFEGVDRVALDTPQQFRLYTLWWMAESSARCWEALGEEIDFSKPEFMACLDALEGVDWRALRYDDFAAENRNIRAVQFNFTYDPLFSEDDWSAGERTLRIRDDAPRISRASGDFSFVPASSTSKATAQAYLEALVAVNHTSVEGSMSERAGYDFATDPEAIAREAGASVTPDSVRRYRERVGDVAFPAEKSTETMLAVRDALVKFVAGECEREEVLRELNAVYGE